MTKPFLKWAGGKSAQVERLRQALPDARRLVEPFVGGGSVFLGTDYPEYLLADINPDLIGMYQVLKARPDFYITEARQLFEPEHNDQDRYLAHRACFNASTDTTERALLFLYLNRHGFNGLCRYNRSGGYNVSFGRYKRPYFPEAELHQFAEKAQRATFVVASFADTFAQLHPGDAVYCDPPYLPLSATANFTDYAGVAFGLAEQQQLAQCAEQAAAQGIPVAISNHDTTQARALYQRARACQSHQVTRTISRNGASRAPVGELLVSY